ncbi:MAG: type II toxin-antitoxin system RelE/ParE family toxin [Segetibacter sp.]
MKKGTYRISEKAVKDLEDIWLYTFETWYQDQADRYYNLLISEIEYVAKHFESVNLWNILNKVTEFLK